MAIASSMWALDGPMPIRTTLFSTAFIHAYGIAEDRSTVVVIARDAQYIESVVAIDLDGSRLGGVDVIAEPIAYDYGMVPQIVGNCVAYVAIPDTDQYELNALYGSCRTDDGWEAPKSLSEGLDENDVVRSFNLTPDATRVLFRVQSENQPNFAHRLYVAWLDGSHAAGEVGPNNEDVLDDVHFLIAN